MGTKHRIIKPLGERRSHWIFLIVCALALSAEDAYAYLDPGTAGVIVQTIVAAVLGAALTIKIYWQRLKDFLRRKFSSSARTEEGKS